MILGRIAVGLIIFVAMIASYFFVEAADQNLDFLIVIIMLVIPALFTTMALYILIQRGWI